MNTMIEIAKKLKGRTPQKPAADYVRVSAVEFNVAQLCEEIQTLANLGIKQFIYEVGKSSSLVETNGRSVVIKPITGKNHLVDSKKELQEKTEMQINVADNKSAQTEPKESGPAPTKTPGHHRIFDTQKGKNAGQESAPTKAPKKKI